MSSLSMTLLLALAAASPVAGGEECEVPGLCVGESVAATDGVASVSDCADLCADTRGCSWFSYDAADGFCGAYESCPLVDAACGTCTSGPLDCDPVGCHAAGGCRGLLLGELSVGGEGECAEACADLAYCNYFVYYPGTGNCVQYGSCDLDGDACSGCYASEVGCGGGYGGGEGEDSLLLVFTTFSQGKIAVVDLDGEDGGGNCSSLDAGPFVGYNGSESVHGTSTGDRRLVACGYDKDSCRYYDPAGDDWLTPAPSRSVDRYLPAGVDLGGVHLATGGKETGGVYLRTSEALDEEAGSWVGGVLDLPVETQGHCAVAVDNSTVFVATGRGTGRRAFLGGPGGNWARLLDLPLDWDGDLEVAACGLAVRPDGSRLLVVAGGEKSESDVGRDETYLFDLDRYGVWLPGPRLPGPRTFAATVPYAGSFLLVGGASAEDSVPGVEFYEDILWFDPDREDWTELPQKLEDPDFAWLALFVPKSFLPNAC